MDQKKFPPGMDGPKKDFNIFQTLEKLANAGNSLKKVGDFAKKGLDEINSLVGLFSDNKLELNKQDFNMSDLKKVQKKKVRPKKIK